MECRSRRLPRGVIPLFSLLVGNAGAAPAALDRYAGTFSGAGTIVEGPEATSHQVRCNFTILQLGATGLSLQGTCRARLIIADPSAPIWPGIPDPGRSPAPLRAPWSEPPASPAGRQEQALT
jgi:hypothetical protein